MHTDAAARNIALFVFAHPDDEFGCFESIRLATARGDRVVCTYLTDGAFGGQPIEPRKRESTDVLARLNVNVADLHFIGAEQGIGDGTLPKHIDAAYNHLCRVMDRYGPVGEIYSTAWEGGHQDHDATYLIAHAYAQRHAVAARVWQFSLYNGVGLKGPLFRVMSSLPSQGMLHALPLDLPTRVSYLGLCLRYPSQWKTWLGLFPFVATTLLFRGTYVVQAASANHRQRPHKGPLLYERRGNATWEEFAHDCAAFMA